VTKPESAAAAAASHPNKVAQEAKQDAIDRFGEADRLYHLWQAPVNPHATERAAALEALEVLYENHPAEASDVADGRTYLLEVSMQQYERVVTPEAYSKAFYKMRLIKTLKGSKIVRFDPFTVFSTTFEAIKKHLGEPFLDSIAPKFRTGRRTYKATAKAAPAVAKEAA